MLEGLSGHWIGALEFIRILTVILNFIAVAAHPPDSSCHKIGEPLTGRGLIQIWCLLNPSDTEEEASPTIKKTRGRPRKKKVVKDKSPQPKRPKGRPRKTPIKESSNDFEFGGQFVQALSVQLPETPSDFASLRGVSSNADEHVVPISCSSNFGFHTEIQDGSSCRMPFFKSGDSTSKKKRRMKDKARAGSYNDDSLSTQNKAKKSSVAAGQQNDSCGENPVASSQKEADKGFLEDFGSGSCLPRDVALPRVVLCLAHNGKVAWDAKWRPVTDHVAESKHRMGYLAVLLGNGSLEVWEVPFPRTIKDIYSSCCMEGTDPRFMKLEPVFRCSKLNCGDRQSIPLTMEWSSSSAHDLILAGCHDGVVALWKFCATGSSQDTRPLLCFSADTVPIRAVAWAPDGSDAECANVIVTASHGGLKFWDIRDPYRALWGLNPVRRVIYSLDWLQYPRCIISSFDDGTLRILSLVKAAYDVPVTGKPFVGTQQQGLYSYYCSSFSIWSVHVSRLTGMVAYCSADGTVLRFQLTTKSVEKDPARNRAPHFLCGSLTLEDAADLTVNTPIPNIPFPMKRSLNEWSNTPRSIRGFTSDSNQAKRASDQTSNDQTLAICYGDESGIGSGSGDATPTVNSKRTSKSKTSSKKKPSLEKGLSATEEPENIQGEENEKREVQTEIEVMPPKIVAMHRVRWNMNKGSERWLCYGGAAGIVRCQEIPMSSVDKGFLIKK